MFYHFTAPVPGMYQFSVCEEEEEEEERDFYPLVGLFQGVCERPICVSQSRLSCGSTR